MLRKFGFDIGKHVLNFQIGGYYVSLSVAEFADEPEVKQSAIFIAHHAAIV